jgi:hypothetical protein
MTGDSEVIYINTDIATAIVMQGLVDQAGPRTQKQCESSPIEMITGTDQEVLAKIPDGCEIFIHDGGIGHIEIWIYHTRIHNETMWNRCDPLTKRKKLEHKEAQGTRDIRQMYQPSRPRPSSSAISTILLSIDIEECDRSRVDMSAVIAAPSFDFLISRSSSLILSSVVFFTLNLLKLLICENMMINYN